MKVLRYMSVLMVLTLASCSHKAPVELMVHAGSSVNAASGRDGMPTLVKVYSFSDIESFTSYRYTDFLHDRAGKASSFVVLPGQLKNIKIIPNSSHKYLGVISLYRDNKGFQWRHISALPRGIFNRKINIYLNHYQILRGKHEH